MMRVDNRAAYVMRVDDHAVVKYAAATPAVRRHADALSRAPQQQSNHELCPLSSTHTKRLPGAS
jgi:hypothetical protein